MAGYEIWITGKTVDFDVCFTCSETFYIYADICLLVKLTMLLSLKNYGWERSTSGFSSKLSDIILMYVYAYTFAVMDMKCL